MLFTALIVISIIAAAIYSVIPKSAQTSICVMVMGDLGRSPRMMYHALSLSENYPDHTIELIGIHGAPLHPLIRSNPRIKINYFQSYPGLPTNIQAALPPLLQRYINLICKVIFQIVDIMTLLLSIEHPQVMLIQTPPAIPLMGVARLMSWILRCSLVVDWHNFGYTLLSLAPAKAQQQQPPQQQQQFQQQEGEVVSRRPPKEMSRVVQLAYYLEWFSGYYANHSFSVTDAMKQWLGQKWGISAHSLHDQPPHIFIPSSALTIATKHSLFTKFNEKQTLTGLYQQSTLPAQITRNSSLPHYTPSQWFMRHVIPAPTTATLCTLDPQTPRQIIDRPFICASSTSWTEDEDFSVLLNGLLLIELLLKDHNATNNTAQSLLCVITGKGELKQYYQLLIDYFHMADNSALGLFEQKCGIKLFPNMMWNQSPTPDWDYTPAHVIQTNPQHFQMLTTILNSAAHPTYQPNPPHPDQFLSILSKIQSPIISLFYTITKQQPHLAAIFPLHNVRLTTAWLDIEDYPTLLSSVDLGISLHQSSSGLDLPMKIVDMFGSCLPVVAVGFHCIGELVEHGKNGLVFPQDNFVQLAAMIYQLIPTVINSRNIIQQQQQQPSPPGNLSNPNQSLPTTLFQACTSTTTPLPQSQRLYPDYIPQSCTLESMSKYLHTQRPERNWKTNWDKIAKPIFDTIITNNIHGEAHRRR